MKHVLSLVLAFAMLTNVFAPMIYAAESVPQNSAGIVQLTEDELAAVSGEAEEPAVTVEPTVEPEEPVATAEPTAEPEEPAATAEPTAEPEESVATAEPTVEPEEPAATAEPTAEPEEAVATAEPTAEPEEPAATAEPTAEPEEPVATAEPTSEPVEAETAPNAAVVLDDSELDPETTAIFYEASEPGWYYGKVPVAKNPGGSKLAENFEFIQADGFHVILTKTNVVVIDGEYWLFVHANNAFEPAEITYRDVWATAEEGMDQTVSVPAAVCIGQPDELPPVMQTSNGFVSSTIKTNISKLTKYDTDYSGTISLDTAGASLLYVSGEGGVQVTQQPNENGEFTFRFPSGIQYVLPNESTPARLWFYAADADGNIYTRPWELNLQPGEQVNVNSETTLYWRGLLSEEGSAITPTLNDMGQSITGWSNMGTVIPDQITAKLMNNNGESLVEPVTATYDAQQDKVIVKSTEMPQTNVDQWYLEVLVPCEEGYTLRLGTYPQKEQLYTEIHWDALSLGLKQGSTLTGKVFQQNEENYQFDIPFTPGEGYRASLQCYGLSMDAEETVDDYLAASFDGNTGKVTVTVLKDLKLYSTNSTFNLTVEGDFAYTYAMSGSIGAPTAYWEGGSPEWNQLLSSEGVQVNVYCYNSPSNVDGWSNMGTITGEPIVTLTQSNGGESTDYSDLLTAYYDEAADRVVLKLAQLPEDMSGYWNLAITMPYEGYEIRVQSQIQQSYRTVRIVPDSGLLSLGTTAGSKMAGTIEVYDESGKYFPMQSELAWNVTISGSGITLASGEQISDYVNVTLEPSTGKLTAEVLKDLECSQNASIKVNAESATERFSTSFSVGIPELDLEFRQNGGHAYSLELREGEEYELEVGTTSLGNYQGLDSLGLKYEAVIYRGNKADGNYPSEEFIDAADYITLTQTNGKIRISIDKMPPLYDYENEQEYKYLLGIRSVNNDFTVSEYSGVHFETGWNPVQLILLKDGSTLVDTLPIKQGEYTYALKAEQNGNSVDLSEVGINWKVTTNTFYLDGKMVAAADYEIRLDLEKMTMTYTLKRDLEGVSGNVQLQGYLGDTTYFSSSWSAGLQNLNLSFYDLNGGESVGGYSYDFNEEKTQFRIIAKNSRGVLVPDSKLSDANYTIVAVEDNLEVPLQESQYFNASIQNHMLRVEVKKAPPKNYGYGIKVLYQDDVYKAEDQITYRTDSSSKYYNLRLIDLSTGENTYNIPIGTPGLQKSYRVLDNQTQQKLSDVIGPDLLGLEIEASNGMDVSPYVECQYDVKTSTLTLIWKDSNLPIRTENGGELRYSLTEVMTPETQGSVSIYAELFRAYLSLNIPQRMALGTKRVCVSREYQIDPDVLYKVTTESGMSVEKEPISVEVTEEGALQLTVAPDAKTGAYKLNIIGTVDGGKYQFNHTSTIEIAETGSEVPGFAYRLETTDAAIYGDDNQYEDGDRVYIPLQSKEAKTTITPVDNSEVADLQISGLTLGTAEKTASGIVVSWNGVKGTDNIVLTASMKDGSQIQTHITIECNIDGELLMYDSPSFVRMGSSVWIVGKQYRVYPLVDGMTLKDRGYTLKYAEILDETYYRVEEVYADGSIVIVPVKTRNSDQGAYAMMEMVYLDENGIERSTSISLSYGTIVTQGNRINFESEDGSVVTEVRMAPGDSTTLQLSDTDIKTVEYGANVTDSLSWTADPNNPGVVTLTMNHSTAYNDVYFYATVTRADGTQTSAYTVVNYQSQYNPGKLPDDSRICFGSKGEDGAYDSWTGSTYQKREGVYTGKLYVFYKDSGENVSETNELVESMKITSGSDSVTILRQGLENGMTFFEYQVDLSQYVEAKIFATATLTNGATCEAVYTINVIEAPAGNQVTVKNAQELNQVLNSATLLPGTMIRLETGDYEGDFVCEVPCTISGNSNQVNLVGTMKCLASPVTVSQIHFVGSGQEIGLYAAHNIGLCSFSGYQTAVAMDPRQNSSYSSYSIMSDTFENNGTAIRFLNKEWYTTLNGCRFINNDVAVEFDSGCVIDGEYSLAYDCVTSRGRMNRNVFYLDEGQYMIVNNASNGATANFTYNYVKYTDAEGTVTEQPTAAMVKGPVLYSPYYVSENFDGVETDESLEDVVDENGNSSLTLVGAQGSSDPNTADSSLQLSGSKFEELRDSDAVKSMEVTVKSTSGETDIIWTFDDNELREDYDGSSVNLGVAFTFTDFEYDMVNNIVKKSTESTEKDPVTGEYISETMESIAYQAMCFSHSGPLPGTATVKVRMNESLMEYYLTHGNSLEGFKVYYLNTETGKLEKMDKTLEVTVEDGVYFYQLDIDHCSSYILTDEELKEDISGFLKIMLGDDAYQLVDNMLSRLPEKATIAEVLSHLTGGTLTVLNQSGERVGENATIATGYTIGLGDGKVGQITAVVHGDVDGNGLINMADLVAIRRGVIGMKTLEGAYLEAATPASKNDSAPQLSDMVRLRRYILGLTTSVF
ncbi:dockerin type I repeat-containing protein [Allofournierella massiliensis]|uniref:Dockerin domain-containing protein n=1 Tax=Allofournierella massiliensis TaxID=1650663 RepID=A0A4R1R197_9FIRM|nr:dockerin type I repeat-containing protein [Fournierella massiliensis]TCL59096.1 hypothetical protein EDD77_1069 [Fournierella massiliensis]